MKYKIEYTQYTVDYDSILRIPRLVYYKIEPDSLKYFGRDIFGPDYNVFNYTTPEDYYDSGYDRGHLFPSASAYSWDAMSESFYMTNITPQLPEFNRGVWKSLELHERSFNSTTYVITGFIPQDRYDYLVGTNIAIPDKYFKVIYVPDEYIMEGYIIPQNGIKPYMKWRVPVDMIENQIGYDLFYQLDDNLENYLESKY
jgi:endonuclease G